MYFSAWRASTASSSTPRPSKSLKRIQANVAKRIYIAAMALATDARPNGCVKLTGESDAYRIRIGDYRVVYVISDAIRIVKVQKIAHRREVYR